MATDLDKKQVVPYISGHCGLGNCEGTQNLSAKGSLLPSCSGVYVFSVPPVVIECQHECHKAFAQIRQLMGELDASNAIDAFTGHATPTVNVDLAPPIQTPSSPASVEISPVSVPIVPPAPVIEAPKPALLPISSIKTFNPTPTGRAARGELEENVRKRVAVTHTHGADMMAMIGLTPKSIAEDINREKPPSQGAVYAIFKRWERDGLVELAEKPFRLIKLTDKGVKELVY